MADMVWIPGHSDQHPAAQLPVSRLSATRLWPGGEMVTSDGGDCATRVPHANGAGKENQGTLVPMGQWALLSAVSPRPLGVIILLAQTGGRELDSRYCLSSQSFLTNQVSFPGTSTLKKTQKCDSVRLPDSR